MLYSFFNKNTNKRNRRLFFFFTILFVICFWTLNHIDQALQNEVSPNGIISFELAKDVKLSQNIISVWNQNHVLVIAGLSIGFDFLYLIIYAFFLSQLVFLIGKPWKSITVRRITQFFIYLIVIAAFFDVLENIGLVQLLTGNFNQQWASMAYYFALLKFILIGLSLTYIIVNGLIVLYRRFI